VYADVRLQSTKGRVKGKGKSRKTVVTAVEWVHSEYCSVLFLFNLCMDRFRLPSWLGPIYKNGDILLHSPLAGLWVGMGWGFPFQKRVSGRIIWEIFLRNTSKMVHSRDF